MTCKCPLSLFSTSRARHPAVPWQTRSLCSFPAAGPARPAWPLPATPGTGDGQGRGLAGTTRGSCSSSPPEPSGTSSEPTVPTQCPGWHPRPSPPCSGGTKPQKEGKRGTADPIPPGDFGDLQGVFIHKERAVTFYSPSGWEYQLCEPHQVHFQWDGTGEVTITLGMC